MYVKICGIRRQEDALLAAELGADAIGLLVGQKHNSPDFVSATVARDISGALPPSVEAVLVTHIEDVDELERLTDSKIFGKWKRLSRKRNTSKAHK